MVPKVSVCIPTYNTARYLPEAIESVLSQSFTDYELIICDNASTDETPRISNQYSDPRIKYFRYENLVGQGGNWNRCLELASGKYVALLHSDDRYLPGFLDDRVEMLDRDPDTGLAFGAVELINPEGRYLGNQVFRPDAFSVPAPDFHHELLMGCVISPVAPMVRRSCYQEVGRFNETRLWGIDWEMWLRLSSRFGVAYTPRITASYRTHDSSGTSTGLLQAKNGAEDLEVLNLAFEQIESRPELAHFRTLKKQAYRRLALRTLYAASYNCEKDNLPGIRRNLRHVLETDWTLLSRPTFWFLWLSGYLGGWVYQGFRTVRPVQPTDESALSP